MKRTFLSLLALIAMGSSVMAGDTPVISVADVYARPGDVVSFSVNLEDGKADTYTAMTLYAQFPATGFTTTDTYTVASGWTGTSCTVGDVDGSGLATIPFASSNAIPGSAVKNLVTVSFQVDGNVAIGNYDVTLQGTMFEYYPSHKDYAANVTFTVHVIDRVPLDENSTVAPTAKNGVNVTVIRTIQANVWNTICLPFTMNEAQLKAAFGNDVQLCQLKGTNGIVKNGDNYTIDFSTRALNKGMAANTPYIIKTSSNVTSFTADGVNIIEGSTEKSTIDDDEDLLGRFIGTLKAGTTIPENNLFLNDNKLYYSTGSTVIKGFRGYFQFTDVVPKSSSAKVTFNVDGEATSIDGMNIKYAVDGVYDLSGRKIQLKDGDLNKLQKGVYIIDGKKVTIK